MVSAPGPVVNEFRGIYVAIGVIWQPTWRIARKKAGVQHEYRWYFTKILVSNGHIVGTHLRHWLHAPRGLQSRAEHRDRRLR